MLLPVIRLAQGSPAKPLARHKARRRPRPERPKGSSLWAARFVAIPRWSVACPWIAIATRHFRQRRDSTRHPPAGETPDVPIVIVGLHGPTAPFAVERAKVRSCRKSCPRTPGCLRRTRTERARAAIVGIANRACFLGAAASGGAIPRALLQRMVRCQMELLNTTNRPVSPTGGGWPASRASANPIWSR